MLYVTTRNRKETYTSHRSIIADTAPDGGTYLPFQMPYYTKEQILALKDKAFNQTVAEILNVFFSSRLTGWDIDFCIGKRTARFISMNHRLLLAELWHNPNGNFDYVVEMIRIKLCGEASCGAPTSWLRTAIRIAVLFGLYGQLCSQQLLSDGHGLDVAVNADDFSMPMAVYYARKMGLPINTVVCSCDDDGCLWDLLNRGSFNTTAASKMLLAGLERLISAVFGEDEVIKFLDICQKKRVYTVTDEQMSALAEGFFCTVAGKKRAESTLNSVYRNNGYIMDPVTALCYSGLQDYRSQTGISRLTLLISDQTPSDFVAEITKATGISKQKLMEQVKL